LLEPNVMPSPSQSNPRSFTAEELERENQRARREGIHAEKLEQLEKGQAEQRGRIESLDHKVDALSDKVEAKFNKLQWWIIATLISVLSMLAKSGLEALFAKMAQH
jgi:hypothetical protein